MQCSALRASCRAHQLFTPPPFPSFPSSTPSSSLCSSDSSPFHDGDKSLSWMRTRGKVRAPAFAHRLNQPSTLLAAPPPPPPTPPTAPQSGQFLGVGDCEILFRVCVGSDPLFGASAAGNRIAIITAKTRDRVRQVATATASFTACLA